MPTAEELKAELDDLKKNWRAKGIHATTLFHRTHQLQKELLALGVDVLPKISIPMQPINLYCAACRHEFMAAQGEIAGCPRCGNELAYANENGTVILVQLSGDLDS